MRICVVGGAGKMAEAAIRDLVESDEVDAIVLADLNEAGLAARKDALASAKIATVAVDVSDAEALAKVLEPVRRRRQLLDGLLQRGRDGGVPQGRRSLHRHRRPLPLGEEAARHGRRASRPPV